MAFDKNFIWGAATSSFQIEGGFDLDGRGPSIWDHFTQVPGKVMRQHSGAIACDHRRQFREDVGIMKDIGLQAYRFSIAWPRVIPEGLGSISASGLDFYSELVDCLLEKGITPWATLYHWDLPWALHLKGGWLNPDIPTWFADYTQVVADRLGDRVKHWMTINEPQVVCCFGYGSGEFAPGWKLSLTELLQVSKNLLLAHGRSVQVLRASVPESQVGWAPVGLLTQPVHETAQDIEAARLATFAVRPPKEHRPQDLHASLWNSSWWMDPAYLGHFPEEGLKHFEAFLPKDFTKGIKAANQPLDFFGNNVYQTEFAASDGHGGYHWVQPGIDMVSNTMGWDVTPGALYWACRYYHERYGLPVYFTENGTPQMDIVENGTVPDYGRIAFMKGYLSGLHRAVQENIPVKGFFYWSLLDNFEWAQGYKQRFGLVHVNYSTQQRTLKQSAHWYRRLIETRGESLGST